VALPLPDMPTPKVATPTQTVNSLLKGPYEPYGTKWVKRVRTVEAGTVALDTAITCRNLSFPRGREYNLPINNCAEMIGFQVGEHLLGYGLSRLIWRVTHNHKLAMLPQLYLIGGNLSGAAYSLEHR
jgi:hypothetical protein